MNIGCCIVQGKSIFNEIVNGFVTTEPTISAIVIINATEKIYKRLLGPTDSPYHADFR